MQKITPCLWFDTQAEEAVNFYIGLFKNSKITSLLLTDAAASEASGMPEGSVLFIEFELDGERFSALNGGPVFKFNESVSLMIECSTQEEIDHYWYGLIADGGQESQCGWLKDRFGLSWQVTPKQLLEMQRDKDSAKAGRVMTAMLGMKKLDIKALQDAFNDAFNNR
jgi:predicted 3-demethylubiquinone-9 3-methyltransferase (glyoxalase superfamily)